VRALGEHADCTRASEGLFAVAHDCAKPGAIVDALRSAVERTSRPEHAVRLGAALAELARRRLADPTVVLEALRRVRKKAPGSVTNLLALADACGELQLWPEAADIAEGALGISRDASERLAAAVLVASAEARVPGKRSESALRARQAEELAGAAPPHAQGTSLSRLSGVYRLLADREAALRVLTRALACSDEPSQVLALLAEHVVPSSAEGAADYARVVEQAVVLARKLDLPVQPVWLIALGEMEATRLGRVPQGVARLRDALALDIADVATHEALARLLTSLGSADHAAREQLIHLPQLLAAPQPGERIAQVLELFARTSASASRHAQENQFAQLAGYLRGDTKSTTAPLSDGAPRPNSLTGADLRALLPEGDTQPWLQVAALVDDVLPKLLRADVAALGVAAKDRIGRGEVHPLRVLADRVARAFGDLAFDLYVDAGTVAAPRLVPSEPPAIVLPRGYGDLPLNEQAAGVGRLLLAVALRVPWLEEVGAGDLAGVLFGSLRAARETWRQGGWTAADEANIESWRVRLAKALPRKHKRALEDIAVDGGQFAEPERFRAAVRAATLIGAYRLTGDLVSTLNHLRRGERELAAPSPESDVHPILRHAATRRLIELVLQDDVLARVRAPSHYVDRVAPGR